MTVEHNQAVAHRLRREYPFFEDHHIQVEKTFRSSKGKIFNAHLISTSRNGYELFVAKGALNLIHQGQELANEFHVLRSLQDEPVSVPQLLEPEHAPSEFLLLSYVPGKTVQEAITGDKDSRMVLSRAGESAGRLHSIRAGGFGDITSKGGDWKAFVDETTNRRIRLLPDGLRNDVEREYHALSATLDEDATREPVVVQRDMHFGNMIDTDGHDEVVLIDFAYGKGGRPIADLSKFYISEFYDDPVLKEPFMQSYAECVPIQDDASDVLRLYIITTALGMINYAHTIGREASKTRPLKVLKELTTNTGVLSDIL